MHAIRLLPFRASAQNQIMQISRLAQTLSLPCLSAVTGAQMDAVTTAYLPQDRHMQTVTQGTRALWAALISNPSEWYDCRQYKVRVGKPTFPDFKHSVTQKGLWLQGMAPETVLQEVGKKKDIPLYKIQSEEDTNEMWSSLFSSPSEWRDCRQFKKARGHPTMCDFRHASTGQGLWLPGDGRCHWAEEQLSKLQVPLYEAPPNAFLWTSLLSNPKEWLDYRQYKAQTGKSKLPDFAHTTTGRGLWMRPEFLPEHVVKNLATANVPLYEGPKPVNARLLSLLSNPSEWRDCRQYKKETGKVSFPDFVKRDNERGALWLTSVTNAQHIAQLSKLQIPLYQGPGKCSSHLWTSLLSSPSEWRDCRQFKIQKGNSRFPDFLKSNDSRAALWLDSAPRGFAAKVAKTLIPLYESSSKAGDDLDAVEATWRSLFNSSAEWRDCRQFKLKVNRPQFPDFKQPSSGIGLWLSSATTPAWVPCMLARVQIPLYDPHQGGSPLSSHAPV